MADDAGTLFVRLCLLGPLLYIGLLMVIDPAGFVTSLSNLARVLAWVLRTFEQEWRGFQWQEPLREPGAIVVSQRTRNALRFFGVILSACALLPLSGLVN